MQDKLFKATSKMFDNLELSHLYQSELFKLIPAVIVVVTDQGRILQANDYLCSLIVKNSDEIINSDFFEVIPENERSYFSSAFQSLSEGCKQMNFCTQAVCKNLSFSFSWSVKKFNRLRRGRLQAYIIIGQDISELTMAQKFLENMNQSLERVVEERTQELMDTNEQLKHEIVSREKEAKEKKEVQESLMDSIEELKRTQEQLLHSKKLESLEKLSTGLAHDFNNILSGITGYSAMLLDDTKNDERLHKRLKTIHSSADRAAQLVRQLLGFAQKIQIHLVKLDFNATVQEALDSSQQSFLNNIIVTEELADDLWEVKGDGRQLLLVIKNILNNAVEAMPKGGKLFINTKNIKATEEVQMQLYGLLPGDYVNLRITDTGVGISDENRDKIFDPFFTTKSIGYGSGLGLSMSFGIVKSHQGFLFLENSESGMTTFSIYLPRLGSGLGSNLE